MSLQQTVLVPPVTTAPEVEALRAPEASLILRDLTERVTSYESNNPDFTGKSPTLDDLAFVSLDIFAPTGERIGRTSGAGKMLFRQEHDDHFIAYFGEEITLDDGNVIRAGGLVDDARLTAGEFASFPAVVVSGPLAGAIGYRQFRPLKDEAHVSYTSSIVLYRP